VSEDPARVYNAIMALTQDECSAVTIPNANPDFNGPNCVIDVSGHWTGYRPLRFEGATLLQALEIALARKEMADERSPG
jgi:hypothetical protein